MQCTPLFHKCCEIVLRVTSTLWFTTTHEIRMLNQRKKEGRTVYYKVHLKKKNLIPLKILLYNHTLSIVMTLLGQFVCVSEQTESKRNTYNITQDSRGVLFSYCSIAGK
ncbi:zinc finger protein 593 [Platysternon megacephalum]|uniref:Zinc finger protein 593 n=1 Tax=Platysternon megacephalum TaxID=55544 RepID=A0A4D9F3B7_9SAUR|nr:zinc finger protein 593 [Platysternon megacephalum]